MRIQALRTSDARSGITLTEILISILIMGVGMLSLATLFPLGLLRIRAAQRDSRSTLLLRSAEGQVSARNLFNKPSFPLTWYGNAPPNGMPFDPWSQDGLNGGVSKSFGPGLPVAYDPLFWSTVHQNSAAAGGTIYSPATSDDNLTASANASLRFGYGPTLRAGPDGACAYGLQRITNFTPRVLGVDWPLTYAPGADVSGEVFTSVDDLVFQGNGGAPPSKGALGATQGNGQSLSAAGNPLLPDLSAGSIIRDWNYSWMFTGYEVDAGEGTVFHGSIVVFQNRPLAVDGGLPAGERVVEGVLGYNSQVIGVVDTLDNTKTHYYGNGDDRIVVIRWAVGEPDPVVTVGSWIADVTYERVPTASFAKFGGTPYSGQRCNWYQVAKTTPADFDPGFASDSGSYRRMVLTLASPVRAKTELMNDGKGSPAHVNAVLISPHVVNVFTKTLYAR